MVTLAWLAEGESLAAAMTPANVELFEREGRGPLTSTVAEAGAFVRTRPGLAVPDIQLHFFPMALPASHFGPPVAGHGFTIGPTLLRPSSRGAVTLRNQLPDTKPRIVHNYLTTAEDRRSLIDGVRISLELAARAPLRAIIRDESAVPRSPSDADILELVIASVRRRSFTPSAPARWARSSTRSCACWASRACASSMRPSCRRCPAATRTRPRS